MFIGFLPKLVLQSTLMSTLSVPNFSMIEARIHVLWQIFRSVRKEEDKNEEKNPNLAPHISEMAGAILFQFGMWTSLPSWHFCSKFGFNRIRNHRATKV